jgi:hypothetical protein
MRLCGGAEGHDYELTMRHHFTHGWAQIGLEIDGEDVADLRARRPSAKSR